MSVQSPAAVGPLADVVRANACGGQGRAHRISPSWASLRSGAIAAMRAMVEGGVDAVEVGLPYSDPLLDGPTIQAAVDHALSSGVTTTDVFDTVRQVADTGVPPW